MTVSSTTNRISYSGNGVTTAFSFPYLFLANGDLVVIERNNTTGAETVKTLTTHYTVSGATNPSGGTVTMLVATPTGTTLVIYRDPALTQSVDLVNGDPLNVDTSIEQPLDRLTMIAQRDRELVERSLRLPDGDTGFTAADMKLPPKVARAGMLLGFDANGKPMASAGTGGAPTSPYMATVLDDTTAAAARSTLGSSATGDAVFTAASAAAARAAIDASGAAELASTSDAAQGDALVGVKRTDTGAVATTQHALNEIRELDVKIDFGAVGDDSTDDTAALVAAYAAAKIRKTRLRLRKGTYKITSQLVWDGEVDVFGDGESTIIKAYGAFDAIKITTSGQESRFEDFTCARGSGAGKGIWLNQTTHMTMNRVKSQGHSSHGFYLYNATTPVGFFSVYSNLTALNNGGDGFYVERHYHSFFVACDSRGNTGYGANFVTGDYNQGNITAQSNTAGGVKIATAQNHLTLYCESNTGTDIELTAASTHNIVTVQNIGSYPSDLVDSGTDNIVIDGVGLIGIRAANFGTSGEATVTMACGTSGTITLNSGANGNQLNWNRVGRVVHVFGYLSVASVSSPVGTLTINGLPYTVTQRAAAAVYADSLTAGANIIGRAAEGGTSIRLSKFAGGVTAAMAGDVQAGSEFYISMTYRA